MHIQYIARELQTSGRVLPSKHGILVCLITILAGVISSDGEQTLVQTEFSTPKRYVSGTDSRGVLLVDLNKDGFTDAVVGRGFGYLTILRGSTTGTFSAVHDYSCPSEIMAIEDLNHDGKLDIVALGSYGAQILLGHGDGSFLVATNIQNAPGYPSSSVLWDLNCDGHLDLAIATYMGIYTAVGRGNGSFSGAAYVSASSSIPGIGAMRAGDIGNGKTDLIVSVGKFQSSSSNITFCVVTNNGSGAFGVSKYYALTNKVGGAALELRDFNGDAKLDVAVLSTRLPSGQPMAVDSVAIWTNKGNGTFFAAAQYPVSGQIPCFLISADFNLDGHVDLLAQAGETAKILYGTGDGSFVPGHDLAIPAAGLAADDIDGDGTPDLAYSSTNSLHVRLNQTPPTLEISGMTGYNQVVWRRTPGFSLEYTTNFCSSPSWLSFPSPPVVIGKQKGITDWHDGTGKLYRLRKTSN